jgi:hypothetical protein
MESGAKWVNWESGELENRKKVGDLPASFLGTRITNEKDVLRTFLALIASILLRWRGRSLRKVQGDQSFGITSGARNPSASRKLRTRNQQMISTCNVKQMKFATSQYQVWFGCPADRCFLARAD